MIILQILLTIWAWRKGWKWYSLIPICIAIIIGIIVAMANVPEINGKEWIITFLGDILIVITLMNMIIFAKNKFSKENRNPFETLDY